MQKRQAKEIALDVFRQPILARHQRRLPLPEGMLDVIQIAAGQTSADMNEAQSQTMQEAAVFFLQQVLMSSENDKLRLLGLNPGATLDTVREHRRWLLKWLHPDRNHNKWESTLFARVNAAAADLELHLSVTPEPQISRLRQNHGRLHKQSHHVLRSRRQVPKWKIVLHICKRLAIIASFICIGYLGLKTLDSTMIYETLASFAQPDQN
jgi:hypothetical protein